MFHIGQGSKKIIVMKVEDRDNRGEKFSEVIPGFNLKRSALINNRVREVPNQYIFCLKLIDFDRLLNELCKIEIFHHTNEMMINTKISEMY